MNLLKLQQHVQPLVRQQPQPVDMEGGIRHEGERRPEHMRQGITGGIMLTCGRLLGQQFKEVHWQVNNFGGKGILLL